MIAIELGTILENDLKSLELETSDKICLFIPNTFQTPEAISTKLSPEKILKLEKS